MKGKKILSVLLTFVFVLFGVMFGADVQELKACAYSSTWAIEVPSEVDSTDMIQLPEGWEFKSTTSLPKGRSVTVMAVCNDPDAEEKTVDVIITRLSDESSSEAVAGSYDGDKDDLLYPRLMKPEQVGSAADSSSAVYPHGGSTKALPNASDDALPITGASAGLASIAAVLLAVSCIIAKNNKK